MLSVAAAPLLAWAPATVSEAPPGPGSAQPARTSYPREASVGPRSAARVDYTVECGPRRGTRCGRSSAAALRASNPARSMRSTLQLLA